MIHNLPLRPAMIYGTIAILAAPAIAQQPEFDAQQPAIAAANDPMVRTTIVEGEELPPRLASPVVVEPLRGDISLNFPSADVGVVARAVLGDLLGLNYSVAGGASRPVSLVTTSPVARSSLLAVFEQSLARSNLALVPTAGGYEIQNASNARAPIAPGAAGFGSEIVMLRFINAEEVRKVLDSVLPGIVISTEPGRNSITIAGSTGQRASARDILAQFDVDWLRNTSFALYIPQRTDSRLIVPSLDKLINDPNSPTRGLVRLISMDQLNGILAISMQPQYLLDVQRWIEILDREGESSEPRIYVYRVQNGRARDLARTINAALGTSNGREQGLEGSGQAGSSFDASSTSSANSPQGGQSGQTGQGSQAGQGGLSGDEQQGGNGNSASEGGRITADEVNNAVIVYATPREYATIEDGLRRLDLPPLQVVIEAAITEVGLNDNMRYGVQWNFAQGNSNVGYSEGNNSTPLRQFPGFSYFYGGTDIAATLNALEEQTNITVISAPYLMTLNNQTAVLQVGDQVPISTGSATNLNSGGDSVVSTIEYRDTGVILRITPRVNESGLVQLDLSQEVSDVSTSSPTAQTQEQTPTISTRRIATTVAVRDGEVIALGGLFRNRQSSGQDGIPFLSQIPVIGALFGTQSTSEVRTELIVLIKPHVIRNPDDARAVTEELRSRMRRLEPFDRSIDTP